MPLHSRWIKIFREIRARPARTLLVTASVLIGVLGVVALFTMADLTIATLDDAIDQDRLAMLRAYVAPRQGEILEGDGGLDGLAALPGIEQIQGMSMVPIHWQRPGEDRFEEGRLFGYSVPLEQMRLEPVELYRGRWPTAGQHEIAVERRFASEHGVGPGDTLVLRVMDRSGDQPTVVEQPWTITGTIFQPYSYPVLPGSPALVPAETMLFAQPDDLHAITGLRGFGIIQARYADFATAQAQESAFKQAITRETPYTSTITLIEDPAQNYLLTQTRIMDSVLSLLAVVALVVAGFLVFNVINAMVLEQRRQIGVLKALGATWLDNVLMYAGIAFMYGLFAVVPGVLIGAPLGFGVAQRITPMFNILIEGFDVSWQAVIVGAALGLIVPVTSALGPVLAGIRVTILAAITDLGINATYHGDRGIARLIDRVPMPVGLRHALRNASQKKGRLLLNVITLALAAGAFMGVFSTFNSFNRILDSVIGQIRIHVSVTPQGEFGFEEVRALLRQEVGGLKFIEPGISLAIDIEGYTPKKIGPGPSFMIASGINPTNAEIIALRLRSGTAWNDDPERHGVVVASVIADGLGVDTGDSLTIHAGGRSATYEIIGVATYLFDTVWVRWDDLATLGGFVRGAPVPNRYVTTLDVDGTPTPALGLDEQARSVIPMVSGEFFAPDVPGVLISEALAARGGYAVGDRLVLRTGGNQSEVPVSGIFTIPAQFAQPGQPDTVIALDWRALAALEGRPLEGEPVPAALSIQLAQDSPSARQVSDKAAEINDVLLARGITAYYTNWISSVEGVTATIEIARLILNTASALIAAIGAIGLLSTLSMSVFERQKEIGVMRSVGATSYTVAFQFLVEGLSVGVIAWLAGIPFSYVLDRRLIALFNFAGAPGTEYTPRALVYGLVGTLLIATFASLWPSIAAARKTVSDILRYQ